MAIAEDVDTVERHDYDLCWCLFYADLIGRFFDVLAILVHAILVRLYRTVPSIAADDASADAAHTASTDGGFECFASPLMLTERFSFHLKSSIQFLRSSRDDLWNDLRNEKLKYLIYFGKDFLAHLPTLMYYILPNMFRGRFMREDKAIKDKWEAK